MDAPEISGALTAALLCAALAVFVRVLVGGGARRWLDLGNLALLVLVAVPPVWAAAQLHEPACAAASAARDDALGWRLLQAGDVCGLGALHPVMAANVLFFAGVCGLMWLISILQGSTWLIDPYWTLLPPLLAAFALTHPRAAPQSERAWASTALLLLWSARLTHSYFRREEWHFGLREDWRFADMRKAHPHLFLLGSFFVVYASQQVMLVGLALPAFSVAGSAAAPWSAWDCAAAALALAGVAIAAVADAQLRAYMQMGAERPAVLRSGLWAVSRHPNYFGENLWWLGYAMFAAAAGDWWAFAGVAVNTAVLAHVITLTEARMLSKPSRAAAFRRYQKEVSAWVPWVPGTDLSR